MRYLPWQRPTQLLLFGPPPLGQRDWFNLNTARNTSTNMTTSFKDICKNAKIWELLWENSYLNPRLHRCRRGGGGVQSYISAAPPTKPSWSENSPQDSTSAGSSSFWMALRICEAQCRFQDWGSYRAHTMAWPRCYTCSKLHTSFEPLPCGDLN